LFTGAIGNIFNESNAESAMQRAAKIEEMIVQYTGEVSEKTASNKTGSVQTGNFADLIKPPLPGQNKISGVGSYQN